MQGMRGDRRRRAVAVLVAAVLVAAVLVAAGCGGDDDGGAAGGAGEGTPQPGGSLTFLASGEVPDLFPDTGAGAVGLGYVSGADRRFAIYDALAIEDADGEVAMRIAESITSDDGVQWTVELRPDVRFSDGTPYDAEAVRFNWERIADPATASPHAITAAAVESIDVVDDLTLAVTLRSPDAGFPRTVARSALTFVGSPTAMRELGEEFGTSPVGAGPYLLDEWVRDDRTVFVRNPDHYGETYLDEIVFRPIVDEAQRNSTFVSGGGDVNTTTDVNIVHLAEQSGATVHTHPTSGGYSYVFNTGQAPFDDVRARRAVSIATDPDAMTDALYAGDGLPTDSFFLPDSPFHDPEVALPGHDRREAQELFDELAAEGDPLAFTITVPNSALAARAEWLQTYLTSNYDDVSVEVDVVPAAQYATDRRAGTFQMIVSFVRFVDPDPTLYNALATGGAENYARYSDPEMDAALVAGREALDDDGRREAYANVQRLLARDVPYYLTHGIQAYNVVDDSVGGFETFAAGVPRWDLLWKAS